MPSEHQLLLFWAQLLVLLLAAKGLGALMRSIGQPPVLGELAAGMLLGPSVLGQVAPDVFAWLFPADPVQKSMLAAVAWIGVLLLLIATGLETDLALLRRLGRATARVSAGSLLVPAFFGVIVGLTMPDTFLGPRAERPVYAIFMAVALSISALPVIAMILSQLNLMRRSVAQMMIAAAMVDDVIGWLFLGVAASLAQSGYVELERPLIALLGLAAFLVVSFTLGQRLIDLLLRRARSRRAGPTGVFTLTLLVALVCGFTTQALGLEAVFGAFVAGILLGRSRFHDEETTVLLERITLSFFAPIFFASAGLRVDLGHLADPQVALWGVIVFVAASVAKFSGAFLGAWRVGLPMRERFALAAGLNARGAVEVVLATVGLSIGVLNSSSYTVIVLMAMATTMLAPPLLRLSLRGWKGSEEEQERLERERMLQSNVLVRSAPVLLPSHGGPNSVLAARIVDLVWPDEVEVTILSAGSDVPEEDLARVRAVFSRRPVVHEHEATKTPIDAIMEYAGLGYGVIAVGATDVRVEGRLVSPVIDELLSASPLPVAIVRGAPGRNASEPLSCRRILVPAIGTAPGRAAQEMAYAVAARTGALVLIAHVVTRAPTGRRTSLPFWTDRARLEPYSQRAEVVESVVEEARAFAAQMGVRAEAVIRTGVSASEEILALIRERQVDLLVVAADLRQLSGRPFLGHGAENLLEKAEATTVVVTAPPAWAR